MWLDELKEKNREGHRTIHMPVRPPTPAQERHGLNRKEHARLAEKTQELREELAAEVRRIDPKEYTEERIQNLLAQTQRTPQRRPRQPGKS